LFKYSEIGTCQHIAPHMDAETEKYLGLL